MIGVGFEKKISRTMEKKTNHYCKYWIDCIGKIGWINIARRFGILFDKDSDS